MLWFHFCNFELMMIKKRRVKKKNDHWDWTKHYFPSYWFAILTVHGIPDLPLRSFDDTYWNEIIEISKKILFVEYRLLMVIIDIEHTIVYETLFFLIIYVEIFPCKTFRFCFSYDSVLSKSLSDVQFYLFSTECLINMSSILYESIFFNI